MKRTRFAWSLFLAAVGGATVSLGLGADRLARACDLEPAAESYLGASDDSGYGPGADFYGHYAPDAYDYDSAASTDAEASGEDVSSQYSDHEYSGEESYGEGYYYGEKTFADVQAELSDADATEPAASTEEACDEEVAAETDSAAMYHDCADDYRYDYGYEYAAPEEQYGDAVESSEDDSAEDSSSEQAAVNESSEEEAMDASSDEESCEDESDDEESCDNDESNTEESDDDEESVEEASSNEQSEYGHGNSYEYGYKYGRDYSYEHEATTTSPQYGDDASDDEAACTAEEESNSMACTMDEQGYDESQNSENRIELFAWEPSDLLSTDDQALLERLGRMRDEPSEIRQAVFTQHLNELGSEAIEFAFAFNAETSIDAIELADDLPGVAAFLASWRLIERGDLVVENAVDVLDVSLKGLSSNWIASTYAIAGTDWEDASLYPASMDDESDVSAPTEDQSSESDADSFETTSLIEALQTVAQQSIEAAGSLLRNASREALSADWEAVLRASAEGQAAKPAEVNRF